MIFEFNSETYVISFHIYDIRSL